MAYLIPGPTQVRAYKVAGKQVPVIAQQKALECVLASIGLVLRLRKHPEASSMTPAALRHAPTPRLGNSLWPGSLLLGFLLR